MKNSKRTYTELIKEICKEEGFKITSFSDDWIFRLQNGKKYRHILGYRFELNTGAVDSICNDKAATSAILASAKIPCVEHHFFLSPENLHYINSSGNWETMVRLFKKYHEKVVCKPNEGTGGESIYFIDNQIALEKFVQGIFDSWRSLAISPFYEIEAEYRVIVLDHKAKLVYKKIIPYVIGDGKSNILQLLAASSKHFNFKEMAEYVQYYTIPLEGEMVRLNWKHNLGLGSSAENVTDTKLIKTLSDIAKKTAQTLNVRFASIDIIKTGVDFKVLEVNSGVMMEQFARMSDENYALAKEIYRDAILKMFE